MSVEPKQLKFAVVHFLHYYIAPRRQDSAKFKWKCIDLLSGITQFNASKNEKRCVAIISEVHLTVFRKYKAWLEEQGHDMTYLFPISNAGNSGTTKVKRPHVSDKSINSWLAKVRKGAEPYYGQTIRPYASHTYRHTLAMRMLDNGVSYENIARILGDTVATIEAHYSELVMTEIFEKQWKRCMVAPMSRRQRERHSRNGSTDLEKFGLQISTSLSYPIHGVRTPNWWRTYQDSNPGFRLRRPK